MKTIQKAAARLGAVSAVLILGAFFSGCPNGLTELAEKPGPGPGGDGETGGYVLVSIGAGISARTLLPHAEELFYTLTFSDVSGIQPNITETLSGGTSKTVGLPGGIWDLAVQGFRSPIDAGGTPAAEGSANNIVVSSGPLAAVDIELEAAQLGSGSLRYSVSWPSSPVVTDAWFTLDKLGGGFTRTVQWGTSSSTWQGQIPNLVSGFYQLRLYAFNGRIAMVGDLVHIYDDLETPASFTLNAGSFADCPDLNGLAASLETAISAREEVRVSVNGTDVPLGVHWVTQAQMDALDGAVAAAEALLTTHGAGKDQTQIDTAAVALDTAATFFDDNTGSYNPAGDTSLGLYIGESSTPETAAGKTLGAILDYLRTHGNGINSTSYAILLGADETLPPWTLGGSGSGSATVFNGKSNITLTLKGKNPGTTINLGSVGSLFRVMEGVKLVLDEHITLRGRTDNTIALLYIGGSVEMKTGSKITGNTNPSSYSGGGVYVSGGTFTMNGGEISDNTSFSSYTSSCGGGVYVEYGTFFMNGGEISDNTSSSGGGVYVSGGTFTMSGGEISDNTSSYGGGGVYVSGGTFTMSGGEISSNISSSSYYYGGGVCVEYGTFTMSGGEISGNIASSSSSGGGVYVYNNGTFAMSGGARVALNNSVYLQNSNTSYASITIGGVFDGTGPVALVEPAVNIGFIGKPFIKWTVGQSGTLPVDRFALAGGWIANANAVLAANAVPLGTPGEIAGAYLGRGGFHFYRFTPVLNKTYNVTHIGGSYENRIYTVAAWADGSGTLMTNTDYYNTTSSNFVASKTGTDIIIMVYNSEGMYTVRYNEVP
jgi:hypothetical protein